METRAVVQIIGTLVACAAGMKDSWREIAGWTAGKLAARFGEAVHVEYFDLFDPGRPTLPEGAQLPLVLVNDQVVSSGGKISIPAIRKRIEALSNRT